MKLLSKLSVDEFRNLITSAGQVVVRELIGTKAEFFVERIEYYYSPEDDDLSLVYLAVSFGEDQKYYSNKEITLYNIESFDLTNIQYLYGLFFGYISHLIGE